MIIQTLPTHWIPRALKKALKARVKGLRSWFAATFRAYDREGLLAALRGLGVRPGDTVMLHSAFSGEHGFRGSAHDVIEVFIDAVGPEGQLLMPSLPYRNAALDWLESGRRFDVRRTPSMMGIVSELFRRRDGVLRSLHPTHPVLAYGPRAAEMLAAHPDCLYPCGPDTPFDQLARADGKVVFFNVPIDTFTCFHFLEHMVSTGLPFRLYTEQLYDARVLDLEGRERIVRTFAFARDAIRRRRPERLYQALHERGSVRERRIGASRLLLLRVRDAIDCTEELRAAGRLFYEFESDQLPQPAENGSSSAR